MLQLKSPKITKSSIDEVDMLSKDCSIRSQYSCPVSGGGGGGGGGPINSTH